MQLRLNGVLTTAPRIGQKRQARGRFEARRGAAALAESRRRNGHLRRDLGAIFGDGAAVSLMVGIGETYLPAFVLALGMRDATAGLVATIPMLAGSVLQLAAPRGLRILRRYRHWVAGCACCQALSLVWLLILALSGGGAAAVFLAATLYWASGLAAGPAWNVWVEHLVPGDLRAGFFARRARISQICIVVGLAAGGVLLRLAPSESGTGAAFAVLFGLAAACRLGSAAFLARQSEPVIGRDEGPGIAAREAPQGFTGGAPAKLVVYLLAVQVSVYLASPYFTPYMLTHLRLSYSQYMSLLCLGFVGKIAALPWCGRLAARSGAHRLLWIGGLGIIPVSAMWLASDSLAYLGLLQVLSGAVWAAFELAMFLLFFDAIPRRRRVTVLTWYNFGNAAAMAAGALLGAVLLECVGCGRIGYLGLFAVSSAARAASFALFPTAIRSRVQSGSVIATRMVAVRPGSGVVGRPIVPNVFGTICELHGGAGVPAQATQVLASSASRPASLGDRPSTHCQPGRRLIAGRIESGLQANAFGKAPHPVAALEPGRRRTAPSGRPAARVA